MFLETLRGSPNLGLLSYDPRSDRIIKQESMRVEGLGVADNLQKVPAGVTVT